MYRRELLRTLGMLTLAGCTAPSSDGKGTSSPGDTTTEPTTREDPTTSTSPTTTVGRSDWSTDFALLDSSCASADARQATVSLEGGTLEVEGTIIGADSCYIAELDRIVYDEQSREFAIVVASVRRADEDTACAPCLTAIEYRITVSFTGQEPERVEIRHRRDDEEAVVTTATF